MEDGLSGKYFKDPYYYRQMPLYEVCLIYKKVLKAQWKKENPYDTRRYFTDKKGKKHVAVKVLDAKDY